MDEYFKNDEVKMKLAKNGIEFQLKLKNEDNRSKLEKKFTGDNFKFSGRGLNVYIEVPLSETAVTKLKNYLQEEGVKTIEAKMIREKQIPMVKFNSGLDLYSEY